MRPSAGTTRLDLPCRARGVLLAGGEGPAAVAVRLDEQTLRDAHGTQRSQGDREPF